MTVTNSQSGTNVHEVADGIYRISTPVTIEGAGGFSFNQYLITDEETLLFHNTRMHARPRMAWRRGKTAACSC